MNEWMNELFQWLNRSFSSRDHLNDTWALFACIVKQIQDGHSWESVYLSWQFFSQEIRLNPNKVIIRELNVSALLMSAQMFSQMIPASWRSLGEGWGPTFLRLSVTEGESMWLTCQFFVELLLNELTLFAEINSKGFLFFCKPLHRLVTVAPEQINVE